MPNFALLMTTALTLALCAGCATQSSTQATGNATAGTAATTSPPTSYTSKQILQLAFDQGYRPRTHDGKTIYCRREVPTGSNLPRTRCVNATELRFEVLQAEHERQQLEESAPMIGQPPGN